jgi:hypothetical protein
MKAVVETGADFVHFQAIKRIRRGTSSVGWIRERTIRTGRPQLVGEVGAILFANRRCHVFSVTVLYCRNLGFLDLSRYFFFQVAPELYSRGWVDPVPDPLLLRKSGSAGNRTWTPGSVAKNSAQ